MKILLCYATAWEWKIIKEQIKNLNLKINLDITYLCTWMWMYETIFNLTKVLNNQDFDIVLNIGVCGYINERKYPDWPGHGRIQVARTVNLTTNKELIVPIFVELGSLESIGCSEKIINVKWEIINYKLQTINYIDMESWAIEYVCDKFRIPRVILKIPVDKIGEEEFNKRKGEILLAENLNYWKMIERLMNYK